MKDNDLTPMRPRPMSKTELGLLYAPNLTPGSALNRLTDWMRHCPPLMDELDRTGYYKQQRLLTSLQVALILKHLGEP